MNKVIAVLGIIVLLTLAMLFFCIGFFTGSSITPNAISTAITAESKNESNIDSKMSTEDIAKRLGDIGDVKSAKLSDKIINILAAAGYTVENFSEIIKTKTSNTFANTFSSKRFSAGENINVDSLLREIVSSHTPQDNCSYQKTMNDIQIRKQAPVTDKTLYGKKIVFIGYFKNAIALQIQKLLTGKGYKTHVEVSKSGDGNDSFIFCGPFKKDSTANNLLKWLKLHNFSEARIVSITKEAIEETLYDAANDLTDLPGNDENISQIPQIATTAVSTSTAVFPNSPSVSGVVPEIPVTTNTVVAPKVVTPTATVPVMPVTPAVSTLSNPIISAPSSSISPGAVITPVVR